MLDETPANARDLSAIVSALRQAPTAADFLAVWLQHKVLSAPHQARLEKYYRSFEHLRSPRLRHWYNEQLREAEQLIRHNPGVRLLEIGCGCGTESLWFAMLGAVVVGLEASSKFASVAEERKRVLGAAPGQPMDCTFHCQPLLKFEDEQGFDLIWMEMAFHHLEPRASVVQRIAELLRPGGWVIVVEVNAANPLLQLQYFLRRGFNTVKLARDQSGEDYLVGVERIVSPRSLRRLFATVGLQCEDMRHYRLLPSHRAFGWLWPIERCAVGMLPRPFHTHYNFVGRKA